ncbi:MAG TPA: sulfite exporter TauE/SafE family protein [Polyangiaceae bacterium]|nr:sulfite exporter TauE/SafE family protein [Polyangiaceae bacterium]
MIEVVASIAAAAVVGSLHCTTMCGGLVAFGSAGAKAGTRAAAISAYNAARGLGYVLLGAAAGAFGSTLDHAGARVGAGRIAGAVAGIVMVLWGAAKLVEAAGVRLRSRAPSSIDVPLARIVRKIRDESPVVRSAIVGGCTAALPCGFLHAFLVGAAGTGSAVRGALVMAAFWLGTLPAVVGLGASVSLVTAPLRRHALAVGGLLLVAFGLSSLFGRWSPRSLSDLIREHAGQQQPDTRGR